MSEDKCEFKAAYGFGLVAETAISKWIQRRGSIVLPVYEKETDGKSTPRAFSATRNLIAPDMLVFSKGAAIWVEVKHKTAFAWHRNSSKWTTGIDRHCFRDYIELRKRTEFKMYLLFLQGSGTAKDTPEGMNSPTGLFGGEILYLVKNIHHESDRCGRHGMVYWTPEILTKIATLEEIFNESPNAEIETI